MDGVGKTSRFKRLYGFSSPDFAEMERKRVAKEAVDHILSARKEDGSYRYQAMIDDPQLLERAAGRLMIAGKHAAEWRHSVASAIVFGGMGTTVGLAGGVAALVGGAFSGGAASIPVGFAVGGATALAVIPVAAAGSIALGRAAGSQDKERGAIARVPPDRGGGRATNVVANAMYAVPAPFLAAPRIGIAAAIAAGNIVGFAASGGAAITSVGVPPLAPLGSFIGGLLAKKVEHKLSTYTVGPGFGVSRLPEADGVPAHVEFNPERFDASMARVLNPDRASGLQKKGKMVRSDLHNYATEHLFNRQTAHAFTGAFTGFGRAVAEAGRTRSARPIITNQLARNMAAMTIGNAIALSASGGAGFGGGMPDVYIGSAFQAMAGPANVLLPWGWTRALNEPPVGTQPMPQTRPAPAPVPDARPVLQHLLSDTARLLGNNTARYEVNPPVFLPQGLPGRSPVQSARHVHFASVVAPVAPTTGAGSSRQTVRPVGILSPRNGGGMHP